MPEIVDVCPLSELPVGGLKIVEVDDYEVGVFRCADGSVKAIENRCSHDDGPLVDGEFNPAACTIECPRHGSLFDLNSGDALTLPAYQPVDVYTVRVEDDLVKLEISDD